MTISISLVVPAYNEAGRLPLALQTIQRYRQEHPVIEECIIVDDGSDDNTADIAAGFAVRETWCTLKRLDAHRGKGVAVRAGMLLAQCEQVFFTDADLSASLANIPPASRQLGENVDVLIGARTHSESRITRRPPISRRIAARFGNILIRVMLGMPYRDTQCGFKGFTRESVYPLFSPMTTAGFMFDVEILARARQTGMRIGEFPLEWADRPGGTFKLRTSLTEILGELYRIRDTIRHV